MLQQAIDRTLATATPANTIPGDFLVLQSQKLEPRERVGSLRSTLWMTPANREAVRGLDIDRDIQRRIDRHEGRFPFPAP